uniref:Ribonucleoprotein PTB-binding 2-like n=1 Tax=Cyanistes caeruleus TaxID=156563 RepID=A0A8C0U7D3_CYACU
MNLMQTALSIFQTPLKKQTSLLGEPPKEIRLSTNPYLNLASVLPGICLPAIASKASSPPQQTSLPNNVMDAAVSQGTASQHAMENYFSYSQQPGEYPQESTGGSCPDYSTCLQVVPPLLSGAQGSQQGLQPPPANPLKQVAPKRSSSYLMSSPEPGPVEFPAPGGAARYSESSLKKKRVY